MRFLILLLALAAFAAPARADITAVYRNDETAMSVRIEVADNGDARFEMSGIPWRMIHKAGIGYAVYQLPGGPLVARATDLQQLAAEQGFVLPRIAMADMTIVHRGTAQVGRWSGRAYHLRMPEGLAPRPQLVISRDRALAPLGPVWLRQIELSMSMIRAGGRPVPKTVAEFRELLATGSPILFAGMPLGSVDNAAIPAARFDLPALPMTLEDLRNGAGRALLRPPV